MCRRNRELRRAKEHGDLANPLRLGSSLCSLFMFVAPCVAIPVILAARTYRDISCTDVTVSDGLGGGLKISSTTMYWNEPPYSPLYWAFCAASGLEACAMAMGDSDGALCKRRGLARRKS